MANSHGRSCIALALVLALLGGPAFAKTGAAFDDAASRPGNAWIASDLGGSDDPPPARAGRVLAISAGAVAGVIVGIVLTSGLATPVGAAAMVTPVVTMAAREGAAYAARTVAVVISTAIGGLLGAWIYHGR